MQRVLMACLACVWVLAWQVDAHAQGTADTVILQDGTLLRGTIVEVSPNAYVVIQTATGETRRFEVANVRYAGPSERAPTAAAEIGEPAPPEEAVQPYQLELLQAPQGPPRPTLGVPAMAFTLGTGLLVLGGVLIPVSYDSDFDDYNKAVYSLGQVIMISGAMLAITGLIWLFVRGKQRRRWRGEHALTVPQFGFAPVIAPEHGHYGIRGVLSF
jgi:hypothetical protein